MTTPTPAQLAAADQEMARLDAAIDRLLGAIRKVDAEGEAEHLHMFVLMSQLGNVPAFNVKALAARLLVRLAHAEVPR